VDLRRFSDIEPVDLRSSFDLAGTELVMVMVANFRQQKDHPTVLRALAELPPEVRRRLGLVFVGSTTSEATFFERCMAMMDELGIGDRIRIAGEQEDPLRLIAGADGAVLASKNETGPLVVLEYMACGVPFVVTDTGEITRAIRHLGIGYTPAPRDHHEVAQALAALLDLGSAGRRAMGDKGREVAASVFDQELVTRGIEEIYHWLLTRGAGAGTRGPRVALRSDPMART
ncbi:MAG: glycosyltransferase, partial [Acidimicrobiia bacterium]|nr:glycosyltransferase [Acidimicrobiia bacterium]